MKSTEAANRSIVTKFQEFYKRHQRCPSYSEIAKMMAYASKNAAYKLADKLIESGFLERDSSGKLRLTQPGLGIPLAGAIQAGFPSPAEEDLLDTISLDDYLIHKPTASFLLKVSGDSMIDAGIHPGDLVIVERGAEAKNGDIVVAQVDGEWTLKYYRKQKTDVFLEAANSKYPLIRATCELTIGGVVRAAIRRYP